MKEMISLKLSKYERDLINKYGYPFDEISDQLEKAKNKQGAVTIKAGRFWMEQLAGGLSRSINHEEISDKRDLWAVDELTERIESALSSRKGFPIF